MEKSNTCWGRDPCKHECLQLASHSTSGGFVLVKLSSHTQTHTHSRSLRHWHSYSHTLPPSIVAFRVSMAPLTDFHESPAWISVWATALHETCLPKVSTMSRRSVMQGKKLRWFKRKHSCLHVFGFEHIWRDYPQNVRGQSYSVILNG